MSVLKEILEWSGTRPDWQRDALRRLVLNGELSDDDLHALTAICKSTHGLAEEQKIAVVYFESSKPPWGASHKKWKHWIVNLSHPPSS